MMIIPTAISENISTMYQVGDGPFSLMGSGLRGGGGRRLAFLRPLETGMVQKRSALSHVGRRRADSVQRLAPGTRYPASLLAGTEEIDPPCRTLPHNRT